LSYQERRVFLDMGEVEVEVKVEAELGGTTQEQGPELLSLYLACDAGDLTRVQQFIEETPDIVTYINKPEKHDRRPLHMAARKGYTEICDILLANGADLEVKTTHGCTALYFAVLSAKVEIVEVLADGYCADVNTADLGLLSPLHIACEKGYADIVKCLLLLGADYKAVDIRGRTPLDWAILRDHRDCIALISPDNPALDSPRSEGEEEDEYGVVQSSDTVRATQVALATRNDGTKVLKYPFTNENNTKPTNPYKIDIYDVY
jgi:ankyrin repeat protein